jgi:hypothetical protein
MRKVVFVGSILGTSAILATAGIVSLKTLPSQDTDLLLALIGIYLAIVIPIGIAYLNEPAFDITVGDPIFREGNCQLVKVRIVSKRNFVRDPRPLVTFYTEGNTASITKKLTLTGKWDSAPEPVLFWEDSQAQHWDFQGWLTRVERAVDILPNKHEELAIAVKFRGEQEFYGFDPWSYRYGWKHPSYKIAGLKSVKVSVEVTSGDVVKTKWFVIENPDTDLLPSFNLRDSKFEKTQETKKFSRPEVVFLTFAVLSFAIGLTLIGLGDITTWREDIQGVGGFLIGDFTIRWYLQRRGAKKFEDSKSLKPLRPALGFSRFFIFVFVIGDIVLAGATFSKLFYSGPLPPFTIAAWSVVVGFAVAIDYVANYRSEKEPANTGQADSSPPSSPKSPPPARQP